MRAAKKLFQVQSKFFCPEQMVSALRADSKGRFALPETDTLLTNEQLDELSQKYRAKTKRACDLRAERHRLQAVARATSFDEASEIQMYHTYFEDALLRAIESLEASIKETFKADAEHRERVQSDLADVICDDIATGTIKEHAMSLAMVNPSRALKLLRDAQIAIEERIGEACIPNEVMVACLGRLAEDIQFVVRCGRLSPVETKPEPRPTPRRAAVPRPRNILQQHPIVGGLRLPTSSNRSAAGQTRFESESFEPSDSDD